MFDSRLMFALLDRLILRTRIDTAGYLPSSFIGDDHGSSRCRCREQETEAEQRYREGHA